MTIDDRTMKALASILPHLLALAVIIASDDQPLSPHLHGLEDLGELRGLTASWDGTALTLRSPEKTPTSPGSGYAWAVIPSPKTGWDLERRASVTAEITNCGTAPLNVLFWVVGDHGWDAVPDSAKLAPGETRHFACDLRATFPDGTPKLDPTQIKQLQVMISGRIAGPAILEVRELKASGEAPEWKRPPTRLDVPNVEDASPHPGHRVRYRLTGDEAIYSVLQLPQDWTPGETYPLIVEYPGNIFLVPSCYSTGLPDQCVIGYGMTKGKGAICLGLPFVDLAAGAIAENGWGVPDDTANYAMRMIEEICTKFGGDRKNIVLTGFSRGAIACGFIGLRNDRIAALWKGFHACQHHDGDGWNGASLEGALERAKRFRGKSVFQTDNSPEKFQPIMDAMQASATFVRSGLGAHATAMFLDDRPSTQELRAWFATLVRSD